MPIVYLGLGSNLGSSENTLNDALIYLTESFDIQMIQCSSLYRSKPLDNKRQPDYINAVASITCGYSAHELLERLQLVENHFGRQREVERWSSRTLDLDILLYDNAIINDNVLTVPHAGLLMRDFVLYPLFEIAPTIKIPGFGLIQQALAACDNRGLEKLNEYDWQPE